MEDDSDGARRQQVEANLTTLYGQQETQEKIDHRAKIVGEDGTINQFQEGALRGAVRRKASDDAEGPAANPPAAASPPPPSLPEELAIDVPDPEPGYADRLDVVALVKAAIGIEGAVRRWGKPQPGFSPGSKTEGIHVRCPFPHHTDNKPSAWINTIKNTWFCGGCQVGGDQLDFYAAAKHDLTPSEFHRKDTFPPILIEMAEDLGIDPDPPQPPPHLTPDPDPPPPPPAPPAPEPTATLPTSPPPLTIAQTTAGIDLDHLEWDARDSADPLEYQGDDDPTYDWRNLDLPRGTFLHGWMTQNEKDLGWIAPEYFMMLGLQAIGLGCGHHQYSDTRGLTTTGTMALVLVGPSGAGKSTAIHQMRSLFDEHPGSRWDGDLGTGIRQFRTPGSAEALLRDIYHEVEDPYDPSKATEAMVTALLIEDEFATFVSRARRPGMEAIKQRVIELLDFSKRRHTPETAVTDSSVTRGKFQLHDPFFSAVFCTQNDVLREQVSDTDMSSGFMNRIIPVFGRPLRSEDPDDWIDSSPLYIRDWGALWNRLRGKGLMTVLPVSEAAKDLLRTDRYMRFLIEIGQRPGMSLVVRMKQHMHQFAYLLAVNEDAAEIGVRHYKIALHMTEFYLQPCYSRFLAAAKATKTKDIATELLAWLHERFDRNREWPAWTEMTRQRFWRNASEQERDIAIKGLQSSFHLTRVKLSSTGGVRRGQSILIATDGADSWSKAYAGDWDKTYTRENFYGHA